MLAPATIRFLTDLSHHNNREWFNKHKAVYLAAKEDFEAFITDLISDMAEINPDLRMINTKDCVFRIYRDIRFSKDKTPYKTHWAAGISSGGKRVHIPGFYLHLAPNGKSIFGGGIWRPDKIMLAKTRQEIDYNFETFKHLIKTIEKGHLFAPFSDEETLSRPPKGYTEDNPALYYLKMRNFTFHASLPDKIITTRALKTTLLKGQKQLQPFLNFLQTALD